MRILILDDIIIEFNILDDIRPEDHNFSHDEVIQSADYIRFLTLLKSRHWDEVWLDHDMGDDKSFNGRDITKYIQQYTEQVDPYDVDLFRIISMNPAVTDSMLSDLVGYNRVATPISVFEDLGVKRGDGPFVDPEWESEEDVELELGWDY